jgi:RNA polymerase sigma-70 factor, ECF subfamily
MATHMTDENQLRDRVRARDATALGEFLQHFRPQLLAYIDRNLGVVLRKKVEPADIWQETAIAALNALPKADLSDRDPFGWLCQIAQQRIIDASRKHAAQKRDSEFEVALNSPAGDSSRDWMSILAASITSPSQAVAREERHGQLYEAIQELPPDVQEILRWRYVEDLPTKDIAARLGKTDVAVRVLLSRTVQKLQELMGD